MNSKLYVGNLPYNTTEADLRTLFEKAGTVSDVMVIKDRESGRSKGFAFVEMGSQEEAESAIKMFNGYSFNQRELKVDIAQPRKERPPQQGRGGGGGGYGRRGPQDRDRRGGSGGGRSRDY